MKTRIAIIGLGAIGSVVAKSLLGRKENVLSYYTRTLKKEIKVIQDGEEFVRPVVCNEAVSDDEFDWVIVCLKAHHFTAAQHLFKHLIEKDTKVAVIRNGIDLKKDLLPFANEEKILPCIIDCSVQPVDRGYYRQLNAAIITSPSSQLSQELSGLLAESTIKFNHSVGFKKDCWKKLIESAAIGTVQCVYNDTSRVFKKKEVLELYKGLLEEGILVANADGANIDLGFKEYLLEKVLGYSADKGSSMLTDFRGGKILELGAKNNVILEVANKYKVHLPLYSRYTMALKELTLYFR